MSRFVLKDYVEKKYSKYLEKINEGIKKDGIYYLFFLRLSPIFPFFIINLVFGLTKMKVLTFYLVSQIGMFLGTIIFHLNIKKQFKGGIKDERKVEL